ncbi:MAG: hypothetical protein HY815_19635, partial [Candidatus Riflebacteria bacterium]|nr:hypothetical protein [Candidatus Riflebacteria bacterium]
QNLTLTPRIMPNDIILLNMTFDDTTRTGWTPVAGVTNGPPGYNLPITARRALVAPMFLKNGSAVIIGGLKSQKNDRSSTKIPILSQIPFIGRNFGRNLKESSTSELVLVLKATVYSQDDF